MEPRHDAAGIPLRRTVHPCARRIGADSGTASAFPSRTSTPAIVKVDAVAVRKPEVSIGGSDIPFTSSAHRMQARRFEPVAGVQSYQTRTSC